MCSASFVPSRLGRGRDVRFLFYTSPVLTKTARRNNTDGLTSDVLMLPLFREYAFQSTRTNVAQPTIVVGFVVPVWSLVGVSANHLGSAGTPISKISRARLLLRYPTKISQPFRSEDAMVSRRSGPPCNQTSKTSWMEAVPVDGTAEKRWRVRNGQLGVTKCRTVRTMVGSTCAVEDGGVTWVTYSGEVGAVVG